MRFWDKIITFVVVLFIIYCITKDVGKQKIKVNKVVSNPKYKYTSNNIFGHKNFYLSDGTNEVWVNLELYLKSNGKEIK